MVCEDDLFVEVTLIRRFFTAQNPLVCLQKALQHTLCSLLTSDMLDMENNSMLKTTCTIFGRGTPTFCSVTVLVHRHFLYLSRWHKKIVTTN